MDVGQPGGIDGDDDAGGLPRRSALDGDDGIADLELSDAPLRKTGRISLVGEDIERRVVNGHLLRICAGDGDGCPLEAYTPGTPVHTLLVVIKPVFVQFWWNGKT